MKWLGMLAWLPALAWAADDPSAIGLARDKNCLACHAIDKKLMGPAFKDVAEKYRGTSSALDALADKVRRGGAGVWGSMPMPANPVTPDEARRLIRWILSGAPAPTGAGPAGEKTSAKGGARANAPGEPKADPAMLARGKYLVNSIMSCGNCHTPRTGDNSVIAGQELSGGRSYDTPRFLITPSNLTSDRETGLGSWSAADLKKALVEGIRPNGLPLAPMMPVSFFKALTPQDLDAVATYILSLPPKVSKAPSPVYRQAFARESYPDAERSYSAREVETNQEVRGKYLATLGHCLDCHTPLRGGHADYEADGGRGGKPVGLERVIAPNITSHPAAGLGNWTDAEIKRALTQGIARDGHTLKYPMPWPFLASLTPPDVDALVAWLRALPPKE